jgi:hypothetical protein
MASLRVRPPAATRRDNWIDMPGRLSLKTINDELARLGHRVLLEKGSGYFYFRTGEAADWLDRTVPVRKINEKTLKEWVSEYKRLKELNAQIIGTVKKSRSSPK